MISSKILATIVVGLIISGCVPQKREYPLYPYSNSTSTSNNSNYYQNNRGSSLSNKCSQAMKLLDIQRRRVQLAKNSVNSYNRPFGAFAGARSLQGAAINAERIRQQRHLAENRLLQMQQELVQSELLISRHCN